MATLCTFSVYLLCGNKFSFCVLREITVFWWIHAKNHHHGAIISLPNKDMRHVIYRADVPWQKNKIVSVGLDPPGPSVGPPSVSKLTFRTVTVSAELECVSLCSQWSVDNESLMRRDSFIIWTENTMMQFCPLRPTLQVIAICISSTWNTLVYHSAKLRLGNMAFILYCYIFR